VWLKARVAFAYQVGSGTASPPVRWSPILAEIAEQVATLFAQYAYITHSLCRLLASAVAGLASVRMPRSLPRILIHLIPKTG
jgi:hypothetical protein